MRYLIIGGTGSLGKKLISRLSSTDEISIYSRDELKQWTLATELQKRKQKNVKFFVGDIRDLTRLKNVIFQAQPNVIISAAALKQVDTCELSPSECIATNLTGTQNLISAVDDYSRAHTPGPDFKVLFVSTDKACAPCTIYGSAKMISERLITSQSSLENGIKYLCTRYGNVLESRGSIIPLFKYQAQHADHITVTNPDMTRFSMTLDESVDLIKEALEHGYSGDTWIPVIKSMRIGDVAEIFSELSGKPIKIVGTRPGEKMHEDLINSSEKSIEITFSRLQKYHVILPSFKKTTVRTANINNINYRSSDDVMTKSELHDYLEKLNILNAPLESFKGQEIEEINTQ